MSEVDRQPHRELCSLCHDVSRVGFHVPNDIWAAAVHVSQIENVICLRCFARLADERRVQWDESITFYPVSQATLVGKQQCECVNSNHAGGRCTNMADMHHFCGPCQSEGAKRMVPSDDERFEQWWNEDHHRGAQSHLKLSARIGWRGALKVARETTDWVAVAQNARKHIAELTGRAERAEKRCVSLEAEAERLRTEVTAVKRSREITIETNINLVHRMRATEIALRANLDSANADFANLHGQHVEALAENEQMKRMLADPPETLLKLNAAREALRRIQASGQSIIDIAKNGMKDE